MNSIDIDIRSSGCHGDLVDDYENDLMDDSAGPNADTNMWTNGANKMTENEIFCKKQFLLHKNVSMLRRHLKECTKSSLNDRSKARRPREQRERKAFSRRQSLIASGTYWESGVRRSKRIKARPLEYWKGERFLYGRVHESLTTVIGLKWISLSKGVWRAYIQGDLLCL